jgi:hypothetical protein
MATVVDAARLSTPGNTIWRTCAGCGTLAPLPPTVDRCPTCDRPDNRSAADRYAAAGWDLAVRHAKVIGRIEAWAVLITDVSDAERLDHIREALVTLHDLRRDAEVAKCR